MSSENYSQQTSINNTEEVDNQSKIEAFDISNCSSNSSRRCENVNFDVLVDRLRHSMQRTLYNIELCSEEMKYVVETFRRNGLIE